MPGGWGGLVAAGIPANSFVRIGVHGSARVWGARVQCELLESAGR